jgi:hypothetical protein
VQCCGEIGVQQVVDDDLELKSPVGVPAGRSQGQLLTTGPSAPAAPSKVEEARRESGTEGQMPRHYASRGHLIRASTVPTAFFGPPGHWCDWRVWRDGHERRSADCASAASRLRAPVQLSGDVPVEDLGGVLGAVEFPLGAHLGQEASGVVVRGPSPQHRGQPGPAVRVRRPTDRNSPPDPRLPDQVHGPGSRSGPVGR